MSAKIIMHNVRETTSLIHFSAANYFLLSYSLYVPIVLIERCYRNGTVSSEKPPTTLYVNCTLLIGKFCITSISFSSTFLECLTSQHDKVAWILVLFLSDGFCFLRVFITAIVIFN